MARSYRHIQQYEKEMLELKAQCVPVSKQPTRIMYQNQLTYRLMYDKISVLI